MAGVGSSSCGACKFLRRKCNDGCVFAPYFSYDQGAIHFAAVHKVFGASNVSKLLLHLPEHRRGDAAVTVAFEAQARMRDPVYGCVAHIFALQQQVATLQEEIESLAAQLANVPAETINGCSNPQTMEGFFQSFQLCMMNMDINGMMSSNNTSTSTGSLNSTAATNANGDESFSDGKENVQGLHPVYREAIDRLEHSLLSDCGNDTVNSTCVDHLSFGSVEDFELGW